MCESSLRVFSQCRLNRLEYLWNFPLFPVPDLIILEILSAIEFFLCEEETLYAAAYFSGTINRHIYSAVLFLSNFYFSRAIIFKFFLIMFSIFWRSVLGLGADTSGVEALEPGRVD
jgi:hypothetical protein